MNRLETVAINRTRVLSDLVRFRRDLHRIPELGMDLPQTIAYVESVLADLDCEVTHPCQSAVCAFFDAGARETTALRADMDALPIAESTGVAFASEHEGCMHACGHDAHMAMVLAAAVQAGERLSADPHAFDRNVLFVFQPAEETTGGAKLVCESGVFERYNATRIFGFHVWPDLPWGTLASRPGPLLARASETHVAIHGASTHIAKTYGVDDAHSADAMLAAARFLVDERALMSRLGEDEPCICKFGVLQSGSVCNAVSGESRIAGSMRVFSDAMFDRARGELERVLAAACAEYGCTYDLDFAEGYPPVTNDKLLYAWVAEQLPELETVEEPLLIAEDFAFYQRHLPGVFFLLGTGEPDAHEGACADTVPGLGYAHSALHTDTLMFDESVLLRGVQTYMRLI